MSNRTYLLWIIAKDLHLSLMYLKEEKQLIIYVCNVVVVGIIIFGKETKSYPTNYKVLGI